MNCLSRTLYVLIKVLCKCTRYVCLNMFLQYNLIISFLRLGKVDYERNLFTCKQYAAEFKILNAFFTQNTPEIKFGWEKIRLPRRMTSR